MNGPDQNLYVGIAGFAVVLFALMTTMIARGAKGINNSKRLEEHDSSPTTE